ncbi:MAG TPA: hypothetical protein VJ836_00210 [Candidatus Saccharimonadales bacterium]|nr:hypothetical protein [Candidatus Saccharimonadales bacterium]
MAATKRPHKPHKKTKKPSISSTKPKAAVKKQAVQQQTSYQQVVIWVAGACIALLVAVDIYYVVTLFLSR